MAETTLQPGCAQANPTIENPALVEAFSTYRTAFAALRAADLNASEAPFYAVMDPADAALRDQPAVTPAGVAMKLKRVFVSFVGESWSDDALLDQRPANFDAKVRASDLYQEMLWRAIEDLERMSPPPLFAAGVPANREG